MSIAEPTTTGRRIGFSATPRCAHCGEWIRRINGAWVHADTGKEEC